MYRKFKKIRSRRTLNEIRQLLASSPLLETGHILQPYGLTQANAAGQA